MHDPELLSQVAALRVRGLTTQAIARELGIRPAEAAATVRASAQGRSAPGFARVDLIIGRRKIYSQALDPPRFLDHSVERDRIRKDYHRVHFGEFVAITGSESYRAGKLKRTPGCSVFFEQRSCRGRP
jgi:hypothetical protein